jgi:hypothetical protein
MLQGRDWFAAPAAKTELLEQLRQIAPVDLPDSYFALLAASDGGEGPLPTSPYTLCLDPSADVIDALRSGRTGSDGFLVFGGNGGGEYLAFDLRGLKPWPVVAIDMVAGAETAETVAPDFDSFTKMIGREADTATVR